MVVMVTVLTLTVGVSDDSEENDSNHKYGNNDTLVDKSVFKVRCEGLHHEQYETCCWTTCRFDNVGKRGQPS